MRSCHITQTVFVSTKPGRRNNICIYRLSSVRQGKLNFSSVTRVFHFIAARVIGEFCCFGQYLRQELRCLQQFILMWDHLDTEKWLKMLRSYIMFQHTLTTVIQKQMFETFVKFSLQCIFLQQTLERLAHSPLCYSKEISCRHYSV